MRKKTSLAFITLLVLVSIADFGSSQIKTVESALKEPNAVGSKLDKATIVRINEAVRKEMSSQKIVGVSVGVIRNSRVVFTQGYGLADRESKTKFSDQTIVNWASNSKPVVAVAAMQLVERGKLGLEDKIKKYLPELPSSCDEVTVRQILCHQSGYPHYSNGRIVPLKTPIESGPDGNDPLFSIKRFAGSSLIYRPREKYSYSSYAFVLLSALIQRAGGEPLPEQISQRITQPLGMKSFQLDATFDDQANWAVGYKKNLLGKVVRVPEQANDWKHGAGGYKSNIVDFSKWAEALINQKLVSKDSEQTMWTAQKTANGKSTDAGLGFFITEQNGTLKVSHGGSQSEARSRMVLYPKQKHGMVVLCNCGHADPAKISTAIYAALRK